MSGVDAKYVIFGWVAPSPQKVRGVVWDFVVVPRLLLVGEFQMAYAILGPGMVGL